MIVQILICVPSDTTDKEFINEVLLQAGTTIKQGCRQGTDAQYRLMNVPDETVKSLLRQITNPS